MNYDVNAILAKVYETFNNPDAWCQGHFAIDKHGCPVSALSADACRFCLMGAVRRAAFKVYPGKQGVYTAVHNKLHAAGGRWPEEINDAPDTTIEDIRQLIAKAME